MKKIMGRYKFHGGHASSCTPHQGQGSRAKKAPTGGEGAANAAQQLLALVKKQLDQARRQGNDAEMEKQPKCTNDRSDGRKNINTIDLALLPLRRQHEAAPKGSSNYDRLYKCREITDICIAAGLSAWKGDVGGRDYIIFCNLPPGHTTQVLE